MDERTVREPSTRHKQPLFYIQHAGKNKASSPHPNSGPFSVIYSSGLVLAPNGDPARAGLNDAFGVGQATNRRLLPRGSSPASASILTAVFGFLTEFFVSPGPKSSRPDPMASHLFSLFLATHWPRASPAIQPARLC
jgi:hypothetical protein